MPTTNIWKDYFDVVILPPAPVRDYAIELSLRFKKHSGARWALGRRKFVPHISLYHIAVRPEDFQAFTGSVQEILNATHLGQFSTTGFDQQLLMFDKPEWIRRLHWSIVRKTVPYFDRGSIAVDTWDLGMMSGYRRILGERYLRRYGTPLIGLNFRPHITLTSLDTHLTPGQQPQLTFKRLKFTPHTLFICELGESHSCQRVVRKIVPDHRSLK
jgi:hypothetical protein